MNEREFILNWNSLFPFDRRWRKKYNIPFNSPQHRSSDPISIFFDLKEDEVVEDMKKKYFEKEVEREKYKKGGGMFKEVKVEESVSEKEMDDLFNNLNLEQFNDAKE